MPVYLDHNAATPLCGPARTAMTAALAVVGNPSSVHAAGRAARRVVEDARGAIAASVGVKPADIVFTGSGTEACQLMLRLGGRSRLLVAATEHAAVLAAAPDGTTIPVQADGLIDLGRLQRQLGQDAGDAVVAVMLANNETGVIQPIREIAEVVHAAGGLLAVDAAQAYGKIPIDIGSLGADAIALSSAKVGGPIGVGAAAFRAGLAPDPVLTGGGQERGLRGGSENVVGIAGFGAAAGDLASCLARQPALASLRTRLEMAILATAPDAAAIGRGAPRLANTAAIPMTCVPAATQVMAFDLAGFAVSAGAACSSGKVARSHVLDAMGLPDAVAMSTIRVSLGEGVDAAAIDAFVQAWRALYCRQAPKRGKAGLDP